MAIYRGDGTPSGGENVYSQADLDTAVAAALASETAAAVSETAAEAAQTAAELAETNAETAETNAETAQTAAETAQTAAELAETNAETAETNAETAETGAEAAQTAAEAAYDSFDDRYLGSKSSEPTLDNDGNALLEGALYWKNTATKTMRIYDGAAWNDVSVSTVTHYNKDDTNALLQHHNVLCNGDFQIWQDGGSFPAAANGSFPVDNWEYSTVGAGVVTASRSQLGAGADLTQSAYALRLDVTTADASLAASDLYYLSVRAETIDVEHFQSGQSNGKELTLHFYHKHTKTGTHCVAVRNQSANRTYIMEYTQTTGSAWEEATLTFTVDTAGSWGAGPGGTGMEVVFVVAVGSNLEGAADTWLATADVATTNQVNNLDNTSNFFEISNVKLELGDVYTGYDKTPFSTMLRWCQRFYETTYTYGVSAGTVTTTGQRRWYLNGQTSAARTIMNPIQYTPKAFAPSIAIYSPQTGTVGYGYDGVATAADTAAVSTTIGTESCTLQLATNGAKTVVDLRAHVAISARLV